jgi:hypothetical protein
MSNLERILSLRLEQVQVIPEQPQAYVVHLDCHAGWELSYWIGINDLTADADCRVAASQGSTEQFFR